jgi:hypothetical protein
MRNTVVTIYGRVGSMKSPIAERIRNACARSGVRCEVDDHRLFSFDEDFTEKYEQAFKQAVQSPADVVVLVVGTGHDSNSPFRIEVEPAIPGVSQLFRLAW